MEAASPPPTSTKMGKRKSHFAEAAAPPTCKRLPVRTPLYRLVPVQRRDDDADTATADAPALIERGAIDFFLAPPAAEANMRVREYQLVRPAQLVCWPDGARDAAATSPPGEEELQALGCKGWYAEGREAVTLWLPSSVDDDSEAGANLLRLVDDDKQAGLTQASLPDMFFRLSMRQPAGGGRA